MSAAKHTPGPWVAEIGKFHAEIRGDEGVEYVASVNANYINPNNQEVLDKTGEANARLIAAAPDLLEALKGLLRSAEFWEQQTKGEFFRLHEANTVIAARAAIAKAVRP